MLDANKLSGLIAGSLATKFTSTPTRHQPRVI